MTSRYFEFETLSYTVTWSHKKNDIWGTGILTWYVCPVNVETSFEELRLSATMVLLSDRRYILYALRCPPSHQIVGRILQ